LGHYNYCDNRKNSILVFSVGFIGRLDIYKGAHVLIDSMNYLTHKILILVINW